MSAKKPNVEIKKNANENNMSVIRRFTRRIQESTMMPIVKSKRYSIRKLSKLAQKKKTLKKITRNKATERLRKLGKVA